MRVIHRILRLTTSIGHRGIGTWTDRFLASLLLISVVALLGNIACARTYGTDENTSPDASNQNAEVQTDANDQGEAEVELVVEDRVEKSVAIVAGPTLLEEEIFYTKVIVRARFVSAKAEYREVARDSFGMPYTNPSVRYVPTLVVELDVLEYLKGSGPSRISMTGGNAYDGVLFTTKEEALEHAHGMVAHRYRENDDRDMILFLPIFDHPYEWIIYPLPPNDSVSGTSEGQDYFGWLTSAMPAITEDVAAGASSQLQMFEIGNVENYRNSAGRLFVSDPSGVNGAQGATTEYGKMTVSELKWWISEVGKLETRAKNDPNFPSFARCLAESWLTIRERNAKGNSDVPRPVAVKIDSGLPAGSAMFGGEALGALAAEAPTQWLTGPAAHLFEAQYIDDDDDRRTGYESRTIVTRPIPAGTYEVGWSYSLPEFALCGLPQEQVREIWNITAASTRDVVHEAFFDPGMLEGGEVGYDFEGAGILSPDHFVVPRPEAKVGINRIGWYVDSIEVEVEPYADLSLYEMDVIELDGTVSLVMPFGSARVRGGGDVRSYVWDQCEQPWHDGDLLMIRIREAGAFGAVGSVPYPRECRSGSSGGGTGPGDSSDATATPDDATAEPEGTATATPDSGDEGAAGGLSGDATAPTLVDVDEEGKLAELFWSAPESPGGEIVGYRVFRAALGDADLTVVVENTGDAGTSYFDDTLSYETTYRYAVAAIYADGTVSSRSNIVVVTTNPFVAEE